MSESYRPVERLQELLDHVRGLRYQKLFELWGPKLEPHPAPFQRIQFFTQAILSGALPDATTLEFMAVRFRRYESSEGTLSLDEAFGLQSKPKGGNPARQYAKTNIKLRLLFQMAIYRAYDPKISIAKAAELTIEGNDASEHISCESLEREYKRRNCKLWEEGLRGE